MQLSPTHNPLRVFTDCTRVFCFCIHRDCSSKIREGHFCAGQTRHFAPKQLLCDYQDQSCEWKKLQSPWGNPPPPESKHRCSTQDKTSQQEKEKDKWRRRKNVLVWRGLLKPLRQVHREEQEQPSGWESSRQFTHFSNTCAAASLLNSQAGTCAADFYEQEGSKHLRFISIEFPGFPNKTTCSRKPVYNPTKFMEFWPQCQQRGSTTQSANTISVISGL